LFRVKINGLEGQITFPPHIQHNIKTKSQKETTRKKKKKKHKQQTTNKQYKKKRKKT
jgi:hypothetical protein